MAERDVGEEVRQRYATAATAVSATGALELVEAEQCYAPGQAEMLRVLRPGGRIGVSDVVAEDHLSAQGRAERARKPL